MPASSAEAWSGLRASTNGSSVSTDTTSQQKGAQSWMDRRRLRGPELLRVYRRMSAEFVTNTGSDVRPPTDKLSARRTTLSLQTPRTRAAGERDEPIPDPRRSAEAVEEALGRLRSERRQEELGSG